MTPRVSVLMSIRDAEATLADALGSVCDQTYRGLEILCVDNGSTDATPKILSQFAARDSRVCLMQNTGTLIDALNAGAAEARGEFLARMDADDLCHPKRIEKQVAFLDENPSLSTASCLVGIRVRREGRLEMPEGGFSRYEAWLNSLVSPEAIFRGRFIESPVANPSALIRRTDFEDVGGYRDTGWPEDYEFWLRLMERKGACIGKVPETLLTWTDSPERLTRTHARYWQKEFFACKVHYLSRLNSVRERGVSINGGGPTGKRLCRLLQNEGATVHAFIDVHPRRTGETIGGVPVLPVESIPPAAPNVPVQLAAAGRPAARERIRNLLSDLGYEEGEDFFCAS